MPAKLRSSPRMRSSSSGWPIDSWICSIIWSGMSSTSMLPPGQGRGHRQLERFGSDARAWVGEVGALQHLQAALLAENRCTGRPRAASASPAVHGRLHRCGMVTMPALLGAATFAGQQQLRHLHRQHAGRPSTMRSSPCARRAITARSARAASGVAALCTGRLTAPSKRPRAHPGQRQLLNEHHAAGHGIGHGAARAKASARPRFAEVGAFMHG